MSTCADLCIVFALGVRRVVLNVDLNKLLYIHRIYPRLSAAAAFGHTHTSVDGKGGEAVREGGRRGRTNFDMKVRLTWWFYYLLGRFLSLCRRQPIQRTHWHITFGQISIYYTNIFMVHGRCCVSVSQRCNENRISKCLDKREIYFSQKLQGHLLLRVVCGCGKPSAVGRTVTSGGEEFFARIREVAWGNFCNRASNMLFNRIYVLIYSNGSSKQTITKFSRQSLLCRVLPSVTLVVR